MCPKMVINCHTDNQWRNLRQDPVFSCQESNFYLCQDTGFYLCPDQGLPLIKSGE